MTDADSTANIDHLRKSCLRGLRGLGNIALLAAAMTALLCVVAHEAPESSLASTALGLVAALHLGSFWLLARVRGKFLEHDTARLFAQSELQRNRDEAVRTGNDKSAFVAMLSHEIRTPLNGVLGLGRLLEASPLAPHQARYARQIVASGELMANIADAVLDLSRIEAGKLRLRSVAFDVRQVVEQACELMEPLAVEKRIALTHHLPGDIATDVVGDSTRLLQVINNLLHNAIKFTACGSVHLDVVGDMCGAGRREFRIEVTDSGIGIDAAGLSRIFEPYGQASDQTAHHYGGTGLGLVIVKKLVTAMDGDIVVRSTVGMGTTFSFTCRFETPIASPSSLPSPKLTTEAPSGASADLTRLAPWSCVDPTVAIH